MRALSGSPWTDTKTLLLAVIADRLGHLAWMFSEDGAKGQNHPASILAAMTGAAPEDGGGYDSGADFLAAWAAITGGEHNGV